MKVKECLVNLSSLEGGDLIKHDGDMFIVIDKPVTNGSYRACLSIETGKIWDLNYQDDVEHYPDATISLGAPKVGS